jgi:hypothetical protein
MAACQAAAEWAGWICKTDGRAQRVYGRLSWAVCMLRTRNGGVLWHASSEIDANVTPSYSRQVLSPAKREALFLVFWARVLRRALANRDPLDN